MYPNNSSIQLKQVVFERIRLVGEPGPGWAKAQERWGTWWEVYVYTSLCVGLILLLWSILNVVAICRQRALASRAYFITLNTMVLVFSMSRVIYLAVDPHSSRGLLEPVVSNLLFNISFPTLTVGYFLTYAALRLCTVPDTQSSRLPLLLKAKFIALFVVLCFIVSIFTDLLVYFCTQLVTTRIYSSYLMIMICQLFYVIWGLVFFILFINLTRLFRKRVRMTRMKMEKSCYRMGHCRRAFAKANMKTLPLYVKISCSASFFTLLLVCLNITRLIIEVGLMKRSVLTPMCEKYRDVWPFYIFLCLEMGVEYLLALSLITCGCQPFRRLQVCRLTTASVVTSARFTPSTELNSLSCISSEQIEYAATTVSGETSGAGAMHMMATTSMDSISATASAHTITTTADVIDCSNS